MRRCVSPDAAACVLALGFGEGADAQAPLARAVVGGLMGSTVITLLLIPAVYSLVHAKDRRPGVVSSRRINPAGAVSKPQA